MKFHRLRLGLSQEEMALRAGLHRTYISDVERGLRNVSLMNVHSFAVACEVPIAILFALAAS